MTRWSLTSEIFLHVEKCQLSGWAKHLAYDYKLLHFVIWSA
jgi:hypothetical protein